MKTAKEILAMSCDDIIKLSDHDFASISGIEESIKTIPSGWRGIYIQMLYMMEQLCALSDLTITIHSAREINGTACISYTMDESNSDLSEVELDNVGEIFESIVSSMENSSEETCIMCGCDAEMTNEVGAEDNVKPMCLEHAEQFGFEACEY